MKFIKKHPYATIFLTLFAFWFAYGISMGAGKSYSFVDIAAATVCAAISASPFWATLAAYRFFGKRKTLPVEGPGISQQALSKRESRRKSKGPASKKAEYDVAETEKTSLATKMSKEALSISLKQARSMDTDLVEVSWIGACCGTCGKYRGRIFSIDGKDKRFPEFPDDFCTECGLMAYAFFDGISRPQYCPSDNYIEYNRRPFFDTRTEEEKQGYQERLRKADRERALIGRERQDGVEYAWIRDNLPELLPKTFTGYRRMKTQNTKNYQKIQTAALEKGYKL